MSRLAMVQGGIILNASIGLYYNEYQFFFFFEIKK
jgi:hypothetical protein